MQNNIDQFRNKEAVLCQDIYAETQKIYDRVKLSMGNHALGF
jgi:hypothetical protein